MTYLEPQKDSYDFDFCLSHNISTSWTMPNYHFHDEFEIVFSLSDTTKIFIEDTMYEVKKNDLFIINSMELHRTIPPHDSVYDRYVIMFNPKYVESFSTESTNLLKCFTDKKSASSNRIHLSPDQAHAMTSIFKKIEHYSKTSAYGSDIYTKINFIEILLLINTLYSSSDTQNNHSSSGNYKKVEAILEYINEHLNEDLSLENLSNKFYLSKYYISHLFKDNTGFSVNEYIISRRILKSRELLKQNIPVLEVSEMVGFNNQCHFIRTFKKLVGISPKQYAKR
jgi:AraC-like DNA-binding protein